MGHIACSLISFTTILVKKCLTINVLRWNSVYQTIAALGRYTMNSLFLIFQGVQEKEVSQTFEASPIPVPSLPTSISTLTLYRLTNISSSVPLPPPLAYTLLTSALGWVIIIPHSVPVPPLVRSQLPSQLANHRTSLLWRISNSFADWFLPRKGGPKPSGVCKLQGD